MASRDQSVVQPGMLRDVILAGYSNLDIIEIFNVVRKIDLVYISIKFF